MVKKNQVIFKLVTLVVLMLSNGEIYSQQGFIYESYLRNKYVARGFICTNSPTIEGSMTYVQSSYRIGVWGIKSFTQSYSEIDLSFEYSKNNFNLSVIDYYNPSVTKIQKYFHISKYHKNHTLDLVLFYRLQRTVPLGFKWSSYIYGNDYSSLTSKRMVSTYVEFSYLFSKRYFDLNLFIGIVPWESWYSDKLSVVNSGLSLESKLVNSKNFTIPSTLSLVYNPSTKQLNISLIFGMKQKKYKKAN